jgi:hypothetical protein
MLLVLIQVLLIILPLIPCILLICCTDADAQLLTHCAMALEDKALAALAV